MRTSGVSLGKIPLFGRRRVDIMVSFSHCQEENKAHFVSRMGHGVKSFRIADLKIRIVPYAPCFFLYNGPRTQQKEIEQ